MIRFVWIPDKTNEWIQAKLINESNDGLNVTVEDSNYNIKSFNKTEICEVDSTHLLDLDDLCLMNNLHEAPLINILKKRWLNNNIYSYAGDVLISINPYKLIPGLYNDYDNYIQLFNKKYPHLYYIANCALNDLINSNNYDAKLDQSIVISGESGAGKTEASKHVINFLIHCNSSNNIINTSALNNLILLSSIIFESFGNAKTVRNDNSSRFAHTETFLLEKSRLVNISSNERNYHIFYEMLSGLSYYNKELYEQLYLSANFDILLPCKSTSNTVNCESETVDVTNDKQNFLNLIASLKALEISNEEINEIFTFLATLLHLGNIVFKETVNRSNEADSILFIELSSCPIEFIIQLLGLNNEEDFLRALTTQRIKIARRSSINVKQLSIPESVNNVLALIKFLYNKLFHYIVNRINKSHSTNLPTKKFIGILDIFGFEILLTNSFEQLCINYTNECLQQYFNEHILQSEQQLYISENIDWEMISFYNNQTVIDCISKKPNGLLNILDEYVVMNRKPDDIALANNYNSINDKSSIFTKGRFGNDTFNIKHYAGLVSYSIHGFIQKNNNTLHDDLLILISLSTNKLINSLLAKDLTLESELGKSKGSNASTKQLSTVSIQFREQLDKLMQTLRNTKPHYIKCIKPNDIKSSSIYSSSLVNLQCKYSGIYEVVRIRREGFPIRLIYEEFYQRYNVFNKMDKFNISQYSNASDLNVFKSYTISIISTILSTNQYQLGINLVFLKENSLTNINIYLNELFNKYATKIQSYGRRLIQRNSYKHINKCVIKIQTYFRKSTNRINYLRTLNAIIKMQINYRRYIKHKKFLIRYKIQKNIKLNKSISAIQNYVRMKLSKKKLLVLKKVQIELSKCIILQSFIRMNSKYRTYLKIRENIRIINRSIRMYLCKKIKRKLIIAFDKLKKYLTSVLRNNRLYKYITKIHNHVMLENTSSIDIKEYISIIDKHYNVNNEINIYQLRNKWSHYQTLSHALCYNKCNNLLAQLFIQPVDLLQYDIRLYTPISISFLYNNIELINYIFNVFNSFNYKSINTIRTIIDEDDNNTSNDVTFQQPNNIVKEGWLKKRNILGIWQKRYAILTESNLLYYNNPSYRNKPNFSIPLEGVIVNRLVDKENILEISLTSKQPQKSFFNFSRNIFQFQTTDEIDLQNWLYPIRAVVGIQSFRSKSIKYILLDLYNKIINESNILYQLIVNYTTVELDRILFMIKCSWLIDKGCSIDYIDSNNKSLTDLIKEKQLHDLDNYIRDINPYLISRQFTRLNGYSYLSIRFEKQVLKNPVSKPKLSLNVYNSKSKLLEDVQHVDTPVIKSNEYVYWGTTWHLHTPFENMDENIYLIIELKDLEKNEEITKIRFDVNKEIIDSKDVILDECLHCTIIISRNSQFFNINDIRYNKINISLIDE